MVARRRGSVAAHSFRRFSQEKRFFFRKKKRTFVQFYKKNTCSEILLDIAALFWYNEVTKGTDVRKERRCFYFFVTERTNVHKWSAAKIKNRRADKNAPYIRRNQNERKIV